MSSTLKMQTIRQVLKKKLNKNIFKIILFIKNQKLINIKNF